MVFFADPMILVITFVVLILALIIGGIVIAAKKSSSSQQAAQPQQQTGPQALNVTTNITITAPIILTGNETVTLKRDYSNQYAPNLIAACVNNQIIGYVDQSVAQIVAPLMDSGVPVSARVLTSTPDVCQAQIYS